MGWGIFRRLERHTTFDQYCELIELLKLDENDLKNPYLRNQLCLSEREKKADYEGKLFEKPLGACLEIQGTGKLPRPGATVL